MTLNIGWDGVRGLKLVTVNECSELPDIKSFSGPNKKAPSCKVGAFIL